MVNVDLVMKWKDKLFSFDTIFLSCKKISKLNISNPYKNDCNKQRERGQQEWRSVSRSAKPGADILISNLSPATWHQIKVIQSS